LQLIILYVVRA